jgi:hypothetical protein
MAQNAGGGGGSLQKRQGGSGWRLGFGPTGHLGRMGAGVGWRRGSRLGCLAWPVGGLLLLFLKKKRFPFIIFLFVNKTFSNSFYIVK